MSIKLDSDAFEMIHSSIYKWNWIDRAKNLYQSIPPVNFSLSNPICLVGVNCPKALIEWTHGVDAHLQGEMSIDSLLGTRVDIARKSCRIRVLTFLEAISYNLPAYSLHVRFPVWHEEVYLEIWDYINLIPELQQLNRIESKIDNIDIYGGA